MENATKALLIAAAVLIVILIIALGMRIFSSTSGATSSATSTGEAIDNQTLQASNQAQGALTNLTSSYLNGTK